MKKWLKLIKYLITKTFILQRAIEEFELNLRMTKERKVTVEEIAEQRDKKFVPLYKEPFETEKEIKEKLNRIRVVINRYRDLTDLSECNVCWKSLQEDLKAIELALKIGVLFDTDID